MYSIKAFCSRNASVTSIVSFYLASKIPMVLAFGDNRTLRLLKVGSDFIRVKIGSSVFKTDRSKVT